jgi:hypothetical protein
LILYGYIYYQVNILGFYICIAILSRCYGVNWVIAMVYFVFWYTKQFCPYVINTQVEGSCTRNTSFKLYGTIDQITSGVVKWLVNFIFTLCFCYKFCSQFMLFASYIDSIILDYCLYPGSYDLVMDLWHVNKWKYINKQSK